LLLLEQGSVIQQLFGREWVDKLFEEGRSRQHSLNVIGPLVTVELFRKMGEEASALSRE
jgi:hypothetical protein